METTRNTGRRKETCEAKWGVRLSNLTRCILVGFAVWMLVGCDASGNEEGASDTVNGTAETSGESSNGIEDDAGGVADGGTEPTTPDGGKALCGWGQCNGSDWYTCIFGLGAEGPAPGIALYCNSGCFEHVQSCRAGAEQCVANSDGVAYCKAIR